MVRSKWLGPVLLVLAVTGLARSQVLPPASPKEHTMTVQETDKPPLKCRLLKSWHLADGAKAYLVQAVATGEMLTVVPPVAAPGEPAKTVAMRIYHWGAEGKSPPGAPLAPADATVLGTPAPPSALASAAPHAKPAAGTAVAQHAAPDGPPVTAEKQWPPAYAPADQTPIQMGGLDTKKADAALKPAAPGMPVEIHGDGPKKVVAGAAAVGRIGNPPYMGGSKSAVTEVLRDGDKPSVQGADGKNPASTVVRVSPTNISPVIEPATPLPTNQAPAADKKVTPAPNVNDGKTTVAQVPPVKPTTPTAPAPAPKVENGKTTVAQAPPPIVPPVPAPSSPYHSTDPKVTPTAPAPAPKVENGKTAVAQAPPPAPFIPPVPPVVTPPAPAVSKNAEPAKPSDWRQSWGRVEPLPPVVKTETPKKSDVAGKTDPPHADATKGDPLLQPDHYTKVPPVVTTTKPQPAADAAKPVQAADKAKPVQVVKNTSEPDAGPVKPPFMMVPEPPKIDKAPTPLAKPADLKLKPAPDLTKADKTPTPPAKPVDVQPDPPLGMGSVAAAEMADPPVVLPPGQKPPAASAPAGNVWDGGNAFSPPQQLPATPNPGSPALPPANYAQGRPVPQPLPAPPPPPPDVPQIPMDRGVPGGLANAFTKTGSTRPMPPDFGQPNVGTNAFSAPAQQMAMPQTPMNPNAGANLMAMADRRPAQATTDMASGQGGSTPQMLAVLRDSLYPSQREWAVDGLASQPGAPSQPQIVQALLSAAKDDPAPTVRAASVRALAQLQLNTVPVATVVQGLKNDPDPRVRREAEMALPVLSGQPLPLDPSVRPVSGH
jgi:HEAT repeats